MLAFEVIISGYTGWFALLFLFSIIIIFKQSQRCGRSLTNAKLFTPRRCGDKSEKKTLKRWRGSLLDRHLCDLLLRCSVRGFIYFFIFWPNSLVTVVEADWQVGAGVLHLCSPSLCVLGRLRLCCEIRNVTENKGCWLTRMMTFAYLKGKAGPSNIHSYVHKTNVLIHESPASKVKAKYHPACHQNHIKYGGCLRPRGRVHRGQVANLTQG